MTSMSKNVRVDKLGDIVNKYNNTYHSVIKIKPFDVKSSIYIDSSKEINDKDPKFKIADIVGISKYKNIFTRVYVPKWSEEVSVIKKVKITVPWIDTSDLKGEETCSIKKLKITNKKEFRVEKVIKRKGDKLYVKSKGYDDSFNSGIGKKDIV